MAKRDPRMIPLGYGKFVRADRVYALVPIEGAERQDGRRTYVHVDGLDQPIVASRLSAPSSRTWRPPLPRQRACRGGGAAGRPGRKAFCRRFG